MAPTSAEVFVDSMTAVCLALEDKRTDLAPVVARARERVHDITTPEQRAAVLAGCRAHSDQLYRQAVFAVLSEKLE